MKIQAKGITDVGRKRGHNEDSFGVFDDMGLYVVADGMGGHAAGEVASHAAVGNLKDFITATTAEEDITWPFERDENLSQGANRLVVGIKLANKLINSLAQSKPELSGMGTTLVALYVGGDEVCVAHVGDSRAYLMSGGVLKRLTNDHSFVEEQVLSGALTYEQARSHPFKNIITRALGVKEDVAVDVSSRRPATGDLYLLCSDGLSGMLTDGDISQILSTCKDDLDSCLKALVKGANAKGGDDNITALAVSIL